MKNDNFKEYLMGFLLKNKETNDLIFFHENLQISFDSINNFHKFYEKNKDILSEIVYKKNINGFYFLLDQFLGTKKKSSNSNCLGFKRQVMIEVFGQEIVDEMDFGIVYFPMLNLSKEDIECVLNNFYENEFIGSIDKELAIIDDEDVGAIEFLSKLKNSSDINKGVGNAI